MQGASITACGNARLGRFRGRQGRFRCDKSITVKLAIERRNATELQLGYFHRRDLVSFLCSRDLTGQHLGYEPRGCLTNGVGCVFLQEM